MEAAEVEDMVEVKLMIGQGVGNNQNVIQVDKTEGQIPKDPVHHSLEHLSSVPEAKVESDELKESKGSDNGCLRHVGRAHGNLKISFLQIEFRKKLGTSYLCREICR